VWITFADGLISAIGSGSAPDGLTPLRGRVVVPGLVDCHVHLTMGGSADIPTEMAVLTEAKARALVTRNAEAQIRSGVTTVRDLGSYRHIVVDMARDLSRGAALSPTIVAAGAISTPEGHGNLIASFADGPAGYAAAARALIARGARAIKVFATGGVITAESSPGKAQMSLEELRATVAIAHEFGVPVAAHAHARVGIRRAVRAGVDSIEHFSYLDEATASMVARSASRLVCTLVATERFVRAAERGLAAPATLAKIIDQAPHERSALRLAVEMGLPLAIGTDAGTTFNPHGWGMQDQAESLVTAGLSIPEALRSLTVEGARLLDEPAGWLGIGRRADLLAVAADPGNDIRALRQVMDVIVRGRRVPLTHEARR
jgi:imidazolonepropionase-like amidohydrolase